jgi:hypothetical protein
MKKLTSLILALAMCFALGAPAFATSQEGNLTTELTSMLPELKMTLPEAATIILNPYRNTVSESVATAAAGIDKLDRLQVMNGVFSVVSTTTNKVHVTATVTGSVGGNAEFASAPVNPGEAGHKVYLTLTYGFDSASATTAAPAVPVPDKLTNPTNVKVISDSEQSLAWDLDAAAASGNGSVKRLNMQFGGSCSDSPSADDGPWTENDTVSCAFVFTVTPVTDFPMLTAVYQATGTAASPVYSDLQIVTATPADYKEAPTIESIKSGAPGAAPSTAVTVSSADTKWDAGKKIILKGSDIGATLGTAPATKMLAIELSYKDKDGVKHTLTYTLKVNVLAQATTA